MSTLKLPTGVELPDWTERAFPPHSKMEGRHCELVPCDTGTHAAELFEAFNQNTEHANWTYLPYGPFDSLAKFSEWLESSCASGDPFFHTVIDLATGRAVGVASYLRITPVIGVIEVGHIHFSPLIQRTTIATEAMFLMMKRVFDELGYRRYEWKCDALNESSKSAAIRYGFTFEGIFRQATIYKGRNRDTAWFSMVDKEWPAVKSAFEKWLLPENFNELGQQIAGLTTPAKLNSKLTSKLTSSAAKSSTEQI